MEPLEVLNTRKKTAARLTRNSKLFKTIIKAIQDKKGEHIISLDLKKIPEAVADFFVICSAGSTTQVKAIADHIEDQVKRSLDEDPYKHEGYGALQWVLVDYVDVVVHVFLPEHRNFYKLEEMWNDAAIMQHED